MKPVASERSTKLQVNDFDGTRLKDTRTLAVMFYAEWCPFCRMFYPEFERAMSGASLLWAEVDISDTEDPLWERFEINVVPTVIIFKNGQSVFRRDGVLGRGLSRKALEETLETMKGLTAGVAQKT